MEKKRDDVMMDRRMDGEWRKDEERMKGRKKKEAGWEEKRRAFLK